MRKAKETAGRKCPVCGKTEMYIPLRQPHLHGKIAAVARSNRIKY